VDLLTVAKDVALGRMGFIYILRIQQNARIVDPQIMEKAAESIQQAAYI